LKNVTFIAEPSSLRSPKEFCEPNKNPHSVTDEDDPIDTVQHVEDEGPSERSSTSLSSPKKYMFVHSFDLNVPYDENDDNQ